MNNAIKKVTISGIAGLAIFMFTMCAYAGPVSGCWGGGDAKGEPAGERLREMKEMKEKLIADLGLTQEQAKQLEEVKKANREGMKDAFKSLQDKRQELAVELEKYNSDPQAVEALKADIKGIVNTLVDKRVENIQEMKKILNEEQYAKFVQKTKEMREEWKSKKSGERRDFKRWW